MRGEDPTKPLPSDKWNPVVGCTKVSTGCKHCPAEISLGESFHQVSMNTDALNEPYTWLQNRVVFVCDDGDLFHEDVKEEYINQVFKVMSSTPHLYLITTKRAHRLSVVEHWPENVRMGISAENQETFDERYKDLMNCGAKTKWLSAQPLLGKVDLPDDAHFDRVLTGGEWGTVYRDMDENWVRHLRDQCQARSIPFCYQQKMLGTKRVIYPELDGKRHMGNVRKQNG